MAPVGLDIDGVVDQVGAARHHGEHDEGEERLQDLGAVEHEAVGTREMMTLPAAGAMNTSTFLAHCLGRQAFSIPFGSPMEGVGALGRPGAGSTMEDVVMGTITVVGGAPEPRVAPRSAG
ncbi:MAG: hypothetical protein V9G12_07960 [Microthrixaceae bacterium]